MYDYKYDSELVELENSCIFFIFQQLTVNENAPVLPNEIQDWISFKSIDISNISLQCFVFINSIRNKKIQIQ